jgi:iron complex outermembrane receptor protein
MISRNHIFNYKDAKLDFIFGGGWNKYEGSHFGKVIWARFASQSALRQIL